MEPLARWTFDVSWQAAILIALVAALRLALGTRLTPNWRCVLWTLVALRLLLPGLVPLPTPSGSAASATLPSAIPPNVTVTVTKIWDGLTTRQQSTSPTLATGQSAWSDSDQSAAPVSSAVITLLSLTWATVTLLLLARLVLTNLRLARRIRRMTPVTDPRILATVTQTAAEMRVTRDVRVVSTADVRTPAVYGLRRPVLLLPSTPSLPPDDLRLVLLHEMAHLRRRDVHVQWLVGLLTAIHWFNPLVWLAAALCRADRELACDAAVLRHVGPDRRHDYGDCLLRVVQSVSPLRPEPAAVGLFGSKRNLRHRLHQIASYRGKRSVAIWTAGAAAFSVVVCAALVRHGPNDRPSPDQPRAAAPDPHPRPAPFRVDTRVIDANAPDPATTAALAKLETRLPDVRFDAVPFRDAIDTLRTQAKSDIFVNWRALRAAGVDPATPVSLHMPDVRFRKALDTMLRDVGGTKAKLGLSVTDGVIWISTADDLARNTVTRVYDVRPLVGLPDAPVAPAPKRDEHVAQLIQLLQTSVAPDSWKDAGGKSGAIRELGGQLLVVQTPENQAQVAQILGQLIDGGALQIQLDVHYVFVDRTTLDDLHLPVEKADARDVYLKEPQVNALLAAVKKSPDSSLLSVPRLTVNNGQRAMLSMKPVPPHAPVETGIELELEATASPGRDAIITTVHSKQTGLRGLKPRPNPADTTTDEPQLSSRTADRTLSIPDRTTALLWAMSPDVTGGDWPKGQAFILIKPTVTVQREAARGDASSPAPRTLTR